MPTDEREWLDVYVSVGNSDDKLRQSEYAAFLSEMSEALTPRPWLRLHGVWFALPHSVYQNACWGISIDPEHVDTLKRRLRELAGQYAQDSIAWAEATTTMLWGRHDVQ